jgi:hypothetical protein
VNWNKLARDERVFISTAMDRWVISSVAERPLFSEGLFCMELVGRLVTASSVAEVRTGFNGAPDKYTYLVLEMEVRISMFRRLVVCLLSHLFVHSGNATGCQKSKLCMCNYDLKHAVFWDVTLVYCPNVSEECFFQLQVRHGA